MLCSAFAGIVYEGWVYANFSVITLIMWLNISILTEKCPLKGQAHSLDSLNKKVM